METGRGCGCGCRWDPFPDVPGSELSPLLRVPNRVPFSGTFPLGLAGGQPLPGLRGAVCLEGQERGPLQLELGPGSGSHPLRISGAQGRGALHRPLLILSKPGPHPIPLPTLTVVHAQTLDVTMGRGQGELRLVWGCGEESQKERGKSLLLSPEPSPLLGPSTCWAGRGASLPLCSR